jgi:mannan endo-1,4-beta-mannosidase
MLKKKQGGSMKKVIIALMLLVIPAIAFCLSIDGPAMTGENGSGLRIAAASISAENLGTLEALKTAGIRTAMIEIGDMAIQKEPGVFDEKQIGELSDFAAAASKNSCGLIISLADDFLKKKYSSWAGASDDNAFFKDALCKSYFKEYLQKVVPIFAESKTALVWELYSGAQDSWEDIYNWTVEMSSYLKSIDGKAFITIEVSNPGVLSNELFKITSLDLYCFDTVLSSKEGEIVGMDMINSGALAAYYGVNKPVMINLKYQADEARMDVAFTDASDVFFKARGSIIIFSSSNTDKAYIDTVKKQCGYASSIKEKVTAAFVNKIKAAVTADSAKISMTTGGDYDIRVAYGEKMPLTAFVGLKGAKKGINTVDITGLEPETKYLYYVSVSGTSEGGISKVMDFTTLKTPKLPAIKFKISTNFIRAKGTDFYDGSRIFRYVGTNNYIMRKYYLDKKDGDKNRHIIDDIFEAAEKAGFKVIRVGSNGEAFDAAFANKDDITHDFRIGPDKFNETAYKSIDYVLDSARRHNIRVILHFTDNWEYYGGVNVYAKWAGVSKNDFWTNDKCKAYYKQTVDAFVKRKNTINGILYRNDPAIFCYDLMNEPRDEADPTGKVMDSWVAEMSSYIKSIDPNHMVTTGMEGFFLQTDGTHYSGTDFISANEIPTIDFCTFHIYPAGQYTHYSPGTTKWTIENFIKQGHDVVKKPVVMEEYGIPNNNDEYPKAQWIDAMTGEFFAAGGNGVNYWMLLDPSYTHGDGNEVYYDQTQYMNIFTKYANEVNKGGY